MFVFDGKNFDSSSMGRWASLYFAGRLYWPVVDFDFSVFHAVADYVEYTYDISIGKIKSLYKCEIGAEFDRDFWHDGPLQFFECVFACSYLGVVACLDYISNNIWAWSDCLHNFAFRVIEISGDSAMMAAYMDFCHKNGIGQSDLVL